MWSRRIGDRQCMCRGTVCMWKYYKAYSMYSMDNKHIHTCTMSYTLWIQPLKATPILMMSITAWPMWWHCSCRWPDLLLSVYFGQPPRCILTQTWAGPMMRQFMNHWVGSMTRPNMLKDDCFVVVLWRGTLGDHHQSASTRQKMMRRFMNHSIGSTTHPNMMKDPCTRIHM